MLQHEEDVNHLQQSAPSGKLFLLGTIESSNVASMAFIDFLIDMSSNNDGARGASSYMYFKKLDNSELELMMQEIRLNNCNGLTVISSLRIFSVGHCRNCCNLVIMSQLYPSEVVTSQCLHCYCSHDVQLRHNWWFRLQQFQCKWKPVTKVLLGEKFVLVLYGGQRLATLDEYRYYNRNIASKSMGATF